MPIILFLICLCASGIGAITGIGGGVIIKPVLDALGIMPVSTISFLSGCTVLTMAAVSTYRTRNNGVQLNFKQSTALALGAAVGGVLGKWLFELIKTASGNENIVGATQTIGLMVLTGGVMLYQMRKGKIQTKSIKNLPLSGVIGLLLGLLSAFLGIGGGPANIAVLSYFFSMDTKTAAKNSIYVILFSQTASLVNTFVQGTVPVFSWSNLILMSLGGVGGALIGAVVSKKANEKLIEKLFSGLMVVIMLICVYNLVGFLGFIQK